MEDAVPDSLLETEHGRQPWLSPYLSSSLKWQSLALSERGTSRLPPSLTAECRLAPLCIFLNFRRSYRWHEETKIHFCE